MRERSSAQPPVSQTRAQPRVGETTVAKIQLESCRNPGENRVGGIIGIIVMSFEKATRHGGRPDRGEAR